LQDPNDEKTWRIYVYDNTYPNIRDRYIEVDTSDNGGKGSWSYTLNSGWGGKKLLFLEPPSSNFLTEPEIPLKNPPVLASADPKVDIYPVVGANVTVTGSGTERTGFDSLKVFEEIPGSYAHILKNNTETPPIFYRLLPDAYSITTDGFPDSISRLTILHDQGYYDVERTDATGAQTDLFSYDGGFAMVNPDPASKIMRMGALITTDSMVQKLYSLRGLSFSQDDSVHLGVVNTDGLRIGNVGSTKTYRLSMESASALSNNFFEHADITLAANSAHTIAPDWNDLSVPIPIYVDLGNDGSVDDTIFAANTTGIGEVHSEVVPVRFSLIQNYPNPFNPTTKIPFAIPSMQHVRITVYDILGREVKTLVDRVISPGVFEVTWDASSRPAGVYYARMTAGNFTETIRLMYIK